MVWSEPLGGERKTRSESAIMDFKLFLFVLCVGCSAAFRGALWFDPTGERIMVEMGSVSSKNEKVDTRNNWVTMVFVTKCRFNCFGKQSHIDTCVEAFKEFEKLGFEFDEIGFGGNHVHFLSNIPKRYSIQDVEIMLKSRSSLRMFEKHPGFRKRYPRGAFWSGYEHHQSTGFTDIEQAREYIKDQPNHHGINVIDDRQ